MFFERFHEISRRSENRSLEEEHPISRTNGVYRFAIVTAPPDPSLIINNFPPGGPGAARVGHAAGILSIIDSSSRTPRRAIIWTILSRRSGLKKGGRELAVSPPFETRLPSLFIVIVLFDKTLRPCYAHFLRES